MSSYMFVAIITVVVAVVSGECICWHEKKEILFGINLFLATKSAFLLQINSICGKKRIFLWQKKGLSLFCLPKKTIRRDFFAFSHLFLSVLLKIEKSAQ